jgi:hypothetical protein
VRTHPLSPSLFKRGGTKGGEFELWRICRTTPKNKNLKNKVQNVQIVQIVQSGDPSMIYCPDL